MDHDTRRFVREARRETKLLIEQCSYFSVESTGAAPEGEGPDGVGFDGAGPEGAGSDGAGSDGAAPVAEAPAGEAFDREIEVIMRSSIGGSANLGFFLPYLWKHRH